MDITNIRHQTIFDAVQHNIPVTIVGVGGIGSRLWLALVELGVTNLTVYDFDNVEAHNIANQIFLNRDIGKPKVDGLKQYYKDKTGAEPPETMYFYNEMFTTTTTLKGVVFMCLDTMDGRRDILKAATNVCPWIFDTRMSSSYGDVFAFNGFDQDKIKAFEQTLFSDDQEVETTNCGSSISVGMTASIIANMAVWQFIHAFTNPAAVDEKTAVFLKPFAIHTEELKPHD